MRFIMRLILILTGVWLFCNGLYVSGISNFNIGYILAMVIGAVLFFYGIFFTFINRFMSHGILKWLRYLSYAGFLFMFGVILFLAFYGQNDNVTGSEDAIIVLGAGIHGEAVSQVLAKRLNAAIAYYEENPAVLIVVSGGQGPQEDITEALAMEHYLIEKGIPQDQIIKEENATSTFENFAYSKKLLDEKLGSDYEVAFVTNGFHVYRAGRIGAAAGLEATHYHAGMKNYMIAVTYPREFLAVMYLWVFGV